MRTEPARLPTVLVAHPSADLYGSDRVMLESVSGFVELGWRVVVTTPTDGPLLDEVRRRGADVAILDIPVLRKSALRPAGLVRLVRDSIAGAARIRDFLRELRPDAVYVSTLTIPLWLPCARLRGIPALCHVHEAESTAPSLVRAGLAAPLLFADRIVANSSFSLRVLTDAIARLDAKVTVVYNGVPGPEAARPPRECLDGALRVAYVGRVSSRKGVQVAVEAIALLTGRGVAAELDIVGDVFPGYERFDRELRERVVALGLESRVRFHGFRPSVWDSLADCDIAVVPSTMPEPFGNTAVEALLAARPVVVSATGGLPEAVVGSRSATTVPPGDPAALADALEAAAGDWERLRTIAQEDARRAAVRHSIRAYRRNVARELAEMLGVDPVTTGADAAGASGSAAPAAPRVPAARARRPDGRSAARPWAARPRSATPAARSREAR